MVGILRAYTFICTIRWYTILLLWHLKQVIDYRLNVVAHSYQIKKKI